MLAGISAANQSCVFAMTSEQLHAGVESSLRCDKPLQGLLPVPAFFPACFLQRCPDITPLYVPHVL